MKLHITAYIAIHIDFSKKGVYAKQALVIQANGSLVECILQWPFSKTWKRRNGQAKNGKNLNFTQIFRFYLRFIIYRKK